MASITEGGGYVIGGTRIGKVVEAGTSLLKYFGVPPNIANLIWYPVSGIFAAVAKDPVTVFIHGDPIEGSFWKAVEENDVNFFGI